jgi:hypothetical protein
MIQYFFYFFHFYFREFCNEAEPESIWDDTYEEHDLSSIKSNCSNTNEHPVIISVPCDDKENFPVQLFLQNDFECTKIKTINLTKENYLTQKDVKIDTLMNNIEHNINIENYATYNKSNQFSTTAEIIKDTGIKEKTKIFSNQSMELTEPVQLLPQFIYESPNEILESEDEITENKTKIFNNKSMEISETIPIYNKDYQLFANIDMMNDTELKEKTEIFSNKSMELTEAFQLLPQLILEAPNEIVESQNETMQNKTKIYNNKSMEISETIPIYNKSYQLPGNIKMTKNDDIIIKENNQIFFNKSMELTEAVQLLPQPINESLNLIVESHDEITQNKTKSFNNKLMEVNKTDPMCNKSYEFCFNVERRDDTMIKEKNQIFINKSMELTDTKVPRTMHESLNQIINSQEKITQNKTKIFSNNSMEISETVPICNINYHPITNVKVIDDTCTKEKTKIFLNKSKELTNLIQLPESINDSCSKIVFNHNEMREHEISNFIEDSLEITEAVSIQKLIDELDTDAKKVHHETTQSKIKIFTDKSLNTIETIPLFKNQQANINIINILSNKTKEKKESFVNKSISIFENTPIYERILKPDTNIGMVLHNKNEIETKDVTNKFMETTEIHQSNENVFDTCHKLIKHKAKIFSNQPIDMTETSRIYNKKHPTSNNIDNALDQTVEEEINVFSNHSMELIQAVPIYQRIDQTENNTNKTLCESSCRNKSFLKHNVDRSDTNTDQNQQNILQERIFIYNASLENIEQSSFHMQIEQPMFATTKNLNGESKKHSSFENMFTRKIFPVCDIPITISKKNLITEEEITDKSTEESLQISNNKSLDAHLTINQHRSSLENILHKSMNEKIKEANYASIGI